MVLNQYKIRYTITFGGAGVSHPAVRPFFHSGLFTFRNHELIAIDPAPWSKHLVKLWSVCDCSHDSKLLYWFWAKDSVREYSNKPQSICRPEEKWFVSRCKFPRCPGYHSWWQLVSMELATANRALWECLTNLPWECIGGKRPLERGSESRRHSRVLLSQALRLNLTRSECGRLRIAPRCYGLTLLKRQIKSIHTCVSWTKRLPSYQAALIVKLDIVSQCQAIHARSIFPCQDTPDIKSTFEFNIRSPLPVIASGLFTGAKDYQPGKDGVPGTLLYTFKQGNPIPSYLFAIASGWVEEVIIEPVRSMYLYSIRDIATASIGPRSSLATGPEELEASKSELEEDTEHFIQAAEVNNALVDENTTTGLIYSLENHSTILVDYLQCSHTPPKLSLWRNGEPELYVCDPNHYIWREFIRISWWRSVLNNAMKRRSRTALYRLLYGLHFPSWRPRTENIGPSERWCHCPWACS